MTAQSQSRWHQTTFGDSGLLVGYKRDELSPGELRKVAARLQDISKSVVRLVRVGGDVDEDAPGTTEDALIGVEFLLATALALSYEAFALEAEAGQLHGTGNR